MQLHLGIGLDMTEELRVAEFSKKVYSSMHSLQQFGYTINIDIIH